MVAWTILGLWCLAIGVSLFMPPQEATIRTCLFRAVTSHPCPTCGGTRVVRSLLRGDVSTACAFNPLVFVFVITAPVAIPTLFRSRGWAWRTRRRIHALTITLVLAVLVNWAYVLWIGPDRITGR